ncbi:hypothetical protein Bca101_058585 [Brassica carinata]
MASFGDVFDSFLLPMSLLYRLCLTVTRASMYTALLRLNFCLSVEIARFCWSRSSSNGAPERKPDASVDACSEPLQ